MCAVYATCHFWQVLLDLLGTYVSVKNVFLLKNSIACSERMDALNIIGCFDFFHFISEILVIE